MLDNRLLEKRKFKVEAFLLISILFLAFLLTFYPHFNYPYLFHVDEWFHVATAKMIASSQKTNWYLGEEFVFGMEPAWHLTLASIQKIFNLEIDQWIYLPAIFHLLAILSVYFFVFKLFGKKEALISALLTALLPSNVTMGGPVFLIPLNLSLIFIPLALTFAFELTNFKPTQNYLALLGIMTFVLYAHPPTAVILISTLTIYFFLNLFSKNKKLRKKALFLFFTVSASVLLSAPNYLPTLRKKGLESIQFNFWIYLKEIPYLFGPIPTIFFILGFYLLSKTRNKETWCLLLSCFFLIFKIFLFVRFNFNWLIPYSRTHIPLFLFMSIITSFGYAKLSEIKKPFKRFGLILFSIFLIATTCFAIDRNLKTPYYRLINDEDYENFLWIKQNSAPESIVLLDPWKARAFVPIAERRVYTVMPFGPIKEQMMLVKNAYNFFSQNCKNTSFLVENKISIIYSPVECQNTDLVNLKDNIYIFEPE